MKTFTTVIQNDAYLQSVYNELIKIESLFQSLQNFIMQSSYIVDFAFKRIDENATADEVMADINTNASSMYRLQSNSIEVIFFYRLIADKLEMERDFYESASEDDKKKLKKPKLHAKFLLQKLNTNFEGSIGKFPIRYELMPIMWDWSESYTPGDDLKWFVYLKDEAMSMEDINESSGKEPRNTSSQIVKARWNKSTSLLAYLFWLLEKEGFIEGNTLAANIASIFQDRNYNDISNDTINSNFHKFTSRGTRPHESNHIKEIIAAIKEIEKS